MLTGKQKEALEELLYFDSTYVFYGGAAGGGKTWLGCVWLLFLLTEYRELRAFIGRDSLKDTRQSVMITWQKAAKSWGFTNWRFGDNCIIFLNGSHIDFLDLSFLPQKDPFFERLGSKEYTCGWIEEAGEIKFEAFDVLKSRIGRHLNQEYGIKSKMLITANPKKGWLYSTFYKPFKDGNLDNNYRFIQALHSDNQFLPDEYRDNLNSITDKIKRQRLIHGIFEYDDNAGSMISYDSINALFTNSQVKGSGKFYLSCDVAGYGSDRFVILVWDGWTVINWWMGIKQPDIALKKINEFKDTYNIPNYRIAYDADGIGGLLSISLPGTIGIINNHSAFTGNYANLKTELYYLLANKINNHEIYISGNPTWGNELIEELEQVRRADVDSDGKLKLISKEDIKGILGRSPDISDAMAYRVILMDR